MPILKDLAGTPLDAIHAAFVDAFSNYEVPMDLPRERLAEMLNTRSYQPTLSVGAFDGERLLAFALTGYRESGRDRLGYDIATGVVQAAQNGGLGGVVVEELLTRGRSAGLTRFLLEVLLNNEAAQRVYRKRGFEVTRRLTCYEIPREILRRPTDAPFEVDALPGLPEGLDERLFCSYLPTWQNALPSLAAARDEHVVRTLSRDGQLEGYGIVHRSRGSILQLGLCEELRNETNVARLAALLADATTAERLVMTNIETDSALDRLAAAAGWNVMVEQFEMAFDFAATTASGDRA